MQHGTVVAEHEPGDTSVGDLIWPGWTTFVPSMRTDHHLCGTVFSCKGRQRPDGTEQRLDLPRYVATPDTAIPVQYLSRLARRNGYGGGEVQLYIVAVRRQQVRAASSVRGSSASSPQAFERAMSAPIRCVWKPVNASRPYTSFSEKGARSLSSASKLLTQYIVNDDGAVHCHAVK